MYWSDKKLQEWADHGGITPVDYGCINPASIDLKLGNFYRIPTETGWSALYDIPPTGLVVQPNAFILLATLETTHIPDNAVAFLYLKSSTGRKGLEHLHAGYGDPGFCGEWTLEVINHWPFPRTIYANDRLFQLCIADCYDVEKTYSKTGHYQHQRNPTCQFDETRQAQEGFEPSSSRQ